MKTTKEIKYIVMIPDFVYKYEFSRLCDIRQSIIESKLYLVHYNEYVFLQHLLHHFNYVSLKYFAVCRYIHTKSYVDNYRPMFN